MRHLTSFCALIACAAAGATVALSQTLAPGADLSTATSNAVVGGGSGSVSHFICHCDAALVAGCSAVLELMFTPPKSLAVTEEGHTFYGSAVAEASNMTQFTGFGWILNVPFPTAVVVSTGLLAGNGAGKLQLIDSSPTPSPLTFNCQ